MGVRGDWACVGRQASTFIQRPRCTARTRSFSSLAAALVLSLAAGPVAAELISAGINGISTPATSQGAATNTDGSVVAFVSDSSQIVTGDTNQVRDVFVRSRTGGATERVSVSSEGVQANRASHSAGGSPAVSGDGSVVAFYSDASNLVPGDSNGQTDVFVRFVTSSATVLVSVAEDGGPANGQSLFPSISADGRYVAFQSQATNLVAGDTNAAADIFVRDLEAGVTVRACAQGNRFSFTPAISDDGNFVAFASAASNLVDGDSNGFVDIFVCDLASGVVERVSVGPGGAQGNHDSILPAISADGQVVAFKSTATNLVGDDHNGVVDVFARNRATGSTERISVNRLGGNADDFSFPPSVSDDGRFVAFGSAATDLIEHDINRVSDVFVRDRNIGVTIVVTRSESGQLGNGGTPDQPPSISGDGMTVAFATAAANLSANDANGSVVDVFAAQNPFFGPGSCPDGTCPEGAVCVDGFCRAPTVTPTPTRTPPATHTPTRTNTATPTPTFRPCEDDDDCEEGEHCRGGFCRDERPCDPDDPGVDLLACFDRETCIDNLCECGGDCNLDGYVLGTEITRAILILAGARELSTCAPADIDLDGNVMGNEITLAIINLDEGCLQEGRPLIFAHDRGETVNLTIRSETDAAAGQATVSIELAQSLNEVATVQLDLLFDPTQLRIDDPSAACRKDPRLADQVLVASLPNSPEAPEGMDRLRLFVGSVSAPVGTFGDGSVIRCTFALAGQAGGGETSLQPERLNVGDARGNTFRVVADDGSVFLPIATPTPAPEPPPACAGDCDHDGGVMGNEITQAIRIMIGDAEMAECPSADSDRDGAVFVTDITRAVINMGLGCPQ